MWLRDEHLKLGKTPVFVKRDLRVLPLTDVEFEADFFLDRTFSTKRREAWSGILVERESGDLLAFISQKPSDCVQGESKDSAPLWPRCSTDSLMTFGASVWGSATNWPPSGPALRRERHGEERKAACPGQIQGRGLLLLVLELQVMVASFHAKRLYVRKYGTTNVISTGLFRYEPATTSSDENNYAP